MSAAMRVAICGGGAIGAATAWFLARAGIEPVIVERAAVACGASGKSGGFLALDWCRDTELDELARRSFALHADLAEAMPDRWGYRGVVTLHLQHGIKSDVASHPLNLLPTWLSPHTLVAQRLGTPESTASLDPAAFTRTLIEAALEAGGSLVRATASKVLRGADGRVTGVVADGRTIEADAVVIAMGPWSNAIRGVDVPPVHAVQGTSLVFKLQDGPTEPVAFFVEYVGGDGTRDMPEVVARADGTVYVSGLSAYPRLPADPSAVAPFPATSDRLLAMVQAFAPGLAACPIVARQACFRPVMRDGLPLIGPVPGAPGAFVATGHSVWGMLNAPATGELLARMITGGSPTVDPTSFTADRPGLA